MQLALDSRHRPVGTCYHVHTCRVHCLADRPVPLLFLWRNRSMLSNVEPLSSTSQCINQSLLDASHCSIAAQCQRHWLTHQQLVSKCLEGGVGDKGDPSRRECVEDPLL